MPKQPAFSGLRDAMKKKPTRRELFLAEMGAVVPWGRLLASMPTAALPTAWRHRPPSCTTPASGTRCCMVRKPRSGPSGHWSAIGPSDNGDGYVSAEREAAFTGPGKAWDVLCDKRSPGSFA